jgi:hypothetical protein
MRCPHWRCHDPAFIGGGDHDGVLTLKRSKSISPFLLEAPEDLILREVAVTDQTDGETRGEIKHAWGDDRWRKAWQGYCPRLPPA